jgi:hypothetical protein
VSKDLILLYPRRSYKGCLLILLTCVLSPGNSFPRIHFLSHHCHRRRFVLSTPSPLYSSVAARPLPRSLQVPYSGRICGWDPPFRVGCLRRKRLFREPPSAVWSTWRPLHSTPTPLFCVPFLATSPFQGHAAQGYSIIFAPRTVTPSAPS